MAAFHTGTTFDTFGDFVSEGFKAGSAEEEVPTGRHERKRAGRGVSHPSWIGRFGKVTASHNWLARVAGSSVVRTIKPASKSKVRPICASSHRAGVQPAESPNFKIA